MSEGKELKNDLMHSLITFVRDNHPALIDKAYEFFWNETCPDEYLTGTALELGFINFEDWLVSDYKINEKGETFIDLFRQSCPGLGDKEENILDVIRASCLSLFEVKSIVSEETVSIRDLLLDAEYFIQSPSLASGLKGGEIFSARLLDIDGDTVLSGALYPFISGNNFEIRLRVLDEFDRYKRNSLKEGTLQNFLKNYGDIFNIMWVSTLTGGFK